MSREMGVGIVGYGKVATGAHRNWINRREDTRLAAVCDMTEVRRQAAAKDNPDAAIYEHFGDLLSDDGVQLIIVTTPPNTHCELAMQAAEAGKHVFVDKPFAMTRAEAEQMIDAAERAGVVIHCHQSRRYDGEYRAIIKCVESGRITAVGWCTIMRRTVAIRCFGSSIVH